MSDQPSQVQAQELTKTKEVIESYLFATSRRDLSIYSERLLMRLVEIAQRQIAGISFRDGSAVGQVSYDELGGAEVEIPIKSILKDDDDNNYAKAKEAIMELMRNPYSVERVKMRHGKPVLDKYGRPEYEFIADQILNHCEVNVKPGVAVLTVNSNTWRAILDFSKGFRKYDLNASFNLKKPCSLRMFKLVSNQTTPITYSVQRLREMWNMEDKYPDVSDFIRGTIESAKKELDKKAPWTFEYVKNHAAHGKSITSVTFFPVRKIDRISTSGVLKAAGQPLDCIDRMSMAMLVRELGFERDGLRNNLVMFQTVKKVGMDLFGFLESIKPKALRATNPPGYVIRAINRHLVEAHGVVITKNGYEIPGC